MSLNFDELKICRHRMRLAPRSRTFASPPYLPLFLALRYCAAYPQLMILRFGGFLEDPSSRRSVGRLGFLTMLPRI